MSVPPTKSDKANGAMTQSPPKDGPKTEGQAEPTAPKAALLAGAPFALQAMGLEIINTTGSARGGRARLSIATPSLSPSSCSSSASRCSAEDFFHARQFSHHRLARRRC